MKKFFAAMLAAGLLMSGCGNQTPAPAPEQKKEEQKPAFEQAVEPVKDAATNAAADVKDAATDAANDVKDAATDAAADVKDAATEMKDAATEAVNDMMADMPEMISTAPSIGTTREAFEMYGDGQYVATFDSNGRVISMEFNTPYIDNDIMASILPSDVVITSFDTNSSDAAKQVNHFAGTSEQLKQLNPTSGGKFDAYTNFDKQTSQFLGGTITVANAQ